jgi:hypothetical protein
MKMLAAHMGRDLRGMGFQSCQALIKAGSNHPLPYSRVLKSHGNSGIIRAMEVRYEVAVLDALQAEGF